MGFEKLCYNVGLSYSFAKIFCTDKAPFCTDVSVFAKIFPFFSLLLSKVVSDFIQNFIKRRRVLLKTQFKRETERQREERTLFHFAIISSFNKTCCRFIVVVRIIIRRPLLVFYEKKALLIKERRFDLYEKRHF